MGGEAWHGRSRGGCEMHERDAARAGGVSERTAPRRSEVHRGAAPRPWPQDAEKAPEVRIAREALKMPFDRRVR
eukprot:691286-Prorocentrum_minimum.AAC.1